MKDTIPIGEFKTHCYKLLDQSQKEQKQLTITKRGKAIAQIIPLNENTKKISLFGMMKNIGSINGDIIKPINVDWEAQNE
jgi:prevent-host-death family protein